MITIVITYLFIASGILYCWRIGKHVERRIEKMDRWSDDVVESQKDKPRMKIVRNDKLPNRNKKHLEIDVFGALREVAAHTI